MSSRFRRAIDEAVRRSYPDDEDDDGHGRGAMIRAREIFPREGPWTGSQYLGAMLIHRAGAPPIGPTQMLLKTGEWWMPHVWSLSLFSQSISVPLDNAPVFSTECIVDFGVGGATQTVEVDFRRGAVLSLVANSITVRVVRPSVDSNIFAQVALGARGACGCPQKTVFEDVLVAAGGTSALFRLPPFTDHLLIERGTLGDIADPLVFVEFSSKLGAPPTIIQSTSLEVITENYGGKIVPVSNAMGFQIENTSANDVRLGAIARLGL